MAYLGNEPLIGAFEKLDNIGGSFNGATTTFALTVGGVAVSPGTAQNLIISLGGVTQNPGVSYTISGTNIVFAAAPAAGVAFWGVRLGDVLNVGTPSDGSVTAAKLAPGAAVSPGAITGSGLTMATSRLLGRTTAGSGAVEEIAVGAGLTLSGGSLAASGGGGMTLLATVTPANGVNAVNVTGLASSKMLMVLSVQSGGPNPVGLSANSAVLVKLSVDNGSSFPGTSIGISSVSTAPLGLYGLFYNTNINAPKIVFRTSSNVAIQMQYETDATVNAGTVNAIQLSANAGVTFNGVGTFYIYGMN